MPFPYDATRTASFLICLAIVGCGTGEGPPEFDPGPDALRARALFTGSEFVAVRGLDVLRSSDGVGWISEAVPEVAPERLVATDGAGTLVGSSFPTEDITELYLSTDARTWERVAEIDARIGSIAYGNGTWIGYAGPTRTLFRSTDGRQWEATELGFSAPSRLGFAGSRFYLYAGTSSVLASENGESWSESSLPISGSTHAVGLADIRGEVSLLAAEFASGSDERTAAYRLREIDGEWVREEIGLDGLVGEPVQAGEEILVQVVGEGRLLRLVDAESWRWETVLASPSAFGSLSAGNQAVVAGGSPMAVSRDGGDSWTGAFLIE